MFIFLAGFFGVGWCVSVFTCALEPVRVCHSMLVFVCVCLLVCALMFVCACVLVC